MWRWVYDQKCCVSKLTNWGTWISFHWVYRPVVARLIKLEAYMQGVGRHTYDQVICIARKDICAISHLLGRYYE